jgi:thioredoxin
MFTEITDDTFKESVSSELDIVIFYKDKCPFCKAMKKIIGKFADKPAAAGKAIGYFQINRETNPKYVASLEIERIPAILVFRNGDKVHEKSGDVSYKQLEKMIA